MLLGAVIGNEMGLVNFELSIGLPPLLLLGLSLVFIWTEYCRGVGVGGAPGYAKFGMLIVQNYSIARNFKIYYSLIMRPGAPLFFLAFILFFGGVGLEPAAWVVIGYCLECAVMILLLSIISDVLPPVSRLITPLIGESNLKAGLGQCLRFVVIGILGAIWLKLAFIVTGLLSMMLSKALAAWGAQLTADLIKASGVELTPSQRLKLINQVCCWLLNRQNNSQDDSDV